MLASSERRGALAFAPFLFLRSGRYGGFGVGTFSMFVIPAKAEPRACVSWPIPGFPLSRE